MKYNNYVRDCCGNIFKIISVDEDIYTVKENGEEFKVSLEELDPYKSADKLIGLVEPFDYVNGMLVIGLGYDEVYGDYVYGYNENGDEIQYFNNQIQNIVTKDKFENNAYFAALDM